MAIDNSVILITVPNKYHKFVNIGNPRIATLYDYFRRRIKSYRWPISDKQRFLFERIIVNLCRRGEIYVKSWVINHERINAWNLPKWLEYSDDIIPIDNERGVTYGLVRDELTLINKLKFRHLGDYIPTSDDYEVLGRIELADPKLADELTNIIEKEKFHGT